MNFDLTGERRKNDSQKIAAIKEWAAEVFRLPADSTVMIAELRCTEPGCPPLETVIAILDRPGQPRQHKIHKALSDVTFADVLDAAVKMRNHEQDSIQE
jgi:hypothetical protein